MLEARKLLDADDVKEGYDKLVELVRENHRSEKHYGLVQKALGYIATKLGEAAVPGMCIIPFLSSQKHAYIILTPLNPTFV